MEDRGDIKMNLDLLQSKTSDKIRKDRKKGDNLGWYAILFLIFILTYAYFAFIYFK